MIDLSALTSLANLGALAASLRLAFYIFTRSPHSDLSRLAALIPLFRRHLLFLQFGRHQCSCQRRARLGGCWMERDFTLYV